VNKTKTKNKIKDQDIFANKLNKGRERREIGVQLLSELGFI